MPLGTPRYHTFVIVSYTLTDSVSCIVSHTLMHCVALQVAKFMLEAAAADSYTAAAIEPIAAPLDAAFLFFDAAGAFEGSGE